jgi:hypothetical protein
VNALANPEVGKFLNENCVCSFQKVATFKIVGNQKQGGNVASYFCAHDGRVLHCIPGPVDAGTFLREAKWIVGVTEKAIDASNGDGAKFKALIRQAHAKKLQDEAGIVVEAITFDPVIEQDPKSALTFDDPTGRPLAPKLPPPPLDGPDVMLEPKANAEFMARQKSEANAPGARVVQDKRGKGWVLGNQGRADMLLAAHGMARIETLYGTVFQDILGEQISTKPVEVVTPFPWREEGPGNRPLTRKGG